jgi:hypothetical protein
MNNLVQRRFAFWQDALGLQDYLILVERISIWQVVGENGRIGASLVGVVVDRKSKVASLVHTRTLREDDILHELCHIKHPDLEHQEVEYETNRLLADEQAEVLASLQSSKERF